MPGHFPDFGRRLGAARCALHSSTPGPDVNPMCHASAALKRAKGAVNAAYSYLGADALAATGAVASQPLGITKLGLGGCDFP